MKSNLKITRAKDYGWRYIIEGNIAGFDIEFTYIDEDNYDATMQSIAQMIQSHVESLKTKEDKQ